MNPLFINFLMVDFFLISGIDNNNKTEQREICLLSSYGRLNIPLNHVKVAFLATQTYRLFFNTVSKYLEFT